MALGQAAAENTIPPLSPGLIRVRQLYRLAAVLALLTLPALYADLALARFFHELHERGPGDLRKAISLFEAFGHGIGAVVIVVGIRVLDPSRGWHCWRLLGCSFGAGIVNLMAKIAVGRSRPQMWDHELPHGVAATFRGSFPLSVSDWAEALERGVQSFPSGHSAMAAGLAVGLAWLYPRGRFYFAALAALTMLQRVESGAHFPSDTLAGAALGIVVAAICCDARLLGSRFDRLRPPSDCLAR